MILIWEGLLEEVARLQKDDPDFRNEDVYLAGPAPAP